MTNMQFSSIMGIATGVMGAIVAGGTVMAALGYSKYGKQKLINDANDSLQKANEDLTKALREIMDTQDRKLVQMSSQISNLEGRVEELSKKNGDLEGIISRALDKFFDLHPEEAVSLSSNLAGKK